jgi:hypothetical protein
MPTINEPQLEITPVSLPWSQNMDGLSAGRDRPCTLLLNPWTPIIRVWPMMRQPVRSTRLHDGVGLASSA